MADEIWFRGLPYEPATLNRQDASGRLSQPYTWGNVHLEAGTWVERDLDFDHVIERPRGPGGPAIHHYDMHPVARTALGRLLVRSTLLAAFGLTAILLLFTQPLLLPMYLVFGGLSAAAAHRRGHPSA